MVDYYEGGTVLPDPNIKIVKDLAVLSKENAPTIGEIIKAATLEIQERNKNLLEVYATEWTIIGRMKKELDKYIENCRICWKKVKVPDLIKHSRYCEKIFKIQEDIGQVTDKFFKNHKIFEIYLTETQLKQNIKSMSVYIF